MVFGGVPDPTGAVLAFSSASSVNSRSGGTIPGEPTQKMKTCNRSNGRWARGAVAMFLLVLAGFAHADAQGDALARARHDLAISEQVLARLTERVEVARADPATSPAERQRLDDYLARVRALVAANRERVRDLEKLVAAAPPGAVGEPGSARPVRAATEAERVAMLDGQLNNSLEAFDKLLLDEARKARTREAAESAATGGASGASGAGSGKRNGAARAGKSGEDESSGAEQNAGESKEAGAEPRREGGPYGAPQEGSPGGPIGGREAGTTGPRTASTAPPDVGDGNDDDIVARQIRKAAEAEADPELRKKLWDEYRKYKQGVSRGQSG